MKRKIIFPIEFIHTTGGMIHSVITLVEELSKKYSVYIIAYKDADIMKMELNAHLLPLRNPWIVSFSNPLKTLRTYLEVKKILRNFEKDILIFTNNVGSELIFSGFGYFPIKGKRIFVSRGGSYAGKTGFFLKKGFEKVTYFIATSRSQKLVLENSGVNSDTIDIIPNGIEIDNSYKKNIKEIKRISVVGYINKNKNQILIIRALFDLIKQGYNNIELNIYGIAFNNTDKKYEKILYDEIHRLSVENFVFFKGYISDKFEIYNNTDILVSTSLSEGFGRSVIEGMSFGIPCIGLEESGGLKDIIKNGINGFLIHNDHLELANSIIKIMNDDNLRNRITSNAYNEYLSKYTTAVMVSNYNNFIEKI